MTEFFFTACMGMVRALQQAPIDRLAHVAGHPHVACTCIPGSIFRAYIRTHVYVPDQNERQARLCPRTYALCSDRVTRSDMAMSGVARVKYMHAANQPGRAQWWATTPSNDERWPRADRSCTPSYSLQLASNSAHHCSRGAGPSSRHASERPSAPPAPAVLAMFVEQRTVGCRLVPTRATQSPHTTASQYESALQMQ